MIKPVLIGLAAAMFALFACAPRQARAQMKPMGGITKSVSSSTNTQAGDAPDTVYNQAVGNFAAGNYEEAARLFQDLIARFGTEPSLQMQMEGVYYALGCSLYNLQKYAEAVAAFTTYLQRFPAAKYRDEALFRIAAAQQALETYDVAVASYGRLLTEMPRSGFAEDAAFQIGVCQLLKQDYNKAAEAFGAFAQYYPESELCPQAVMFQGRSLFELGKLAEALAAISSLEGRRQRWGTLVYANFLAFEIADAAYDNTDYELALRAYRRVQPRQSLLRIQRRTVQDLKATLETFQRVKPDPTTAAARFRQERRLAAGLAQAQELLQKLDTMPDYDAGLFHRIGRCFFNIDRYWEARVAFTRVVAEATDETIREAAHFDLILVISRMRQFEDLIAEADRYLARYDSK